MNQFSGHHLSDHVAVCFDCKRQHIIAKSERMSAQPWLDWLTKHKDCRTAVFDERLLGKLDDITRQVGHFAHNEDVKVSYVASAAYTITLTGLATDASLLTGREGTALSNASNKYLDIIFTGRITTGTSPTAAKQIEAHIIGALDDTPTYPDVFDGTDSAETITSADIKASICRQAGFTTTSNTSDRSYDFAPQGIACLFGGILPVAHVPFVTHNTGQNLNATAANQFLKHTQVYRTIA